jgi:hypothetical protein
MPVASARRIRHAVGGPSSVPRVAAGPASRPPRLPVAGLIAVGAATALLLVGLLAATLASGLTVADAVADPEETTGHRFLGVVSNVGLLLWAATVAIGLFGALLVDASSPRGREWRWFLAAMAGVAFLLLVDDFLLVHEFGDDIALSFVDFDPTRGRKNIIETTVFAGYGLVALACAWRFRDRLRQVDRRPLWIAAALLGLSFVVDMRLHRITGLRLPDGSDGPDLQSILEEGPKLLGIAYLVVFVALAGRRAIEDGRTTGGSGGADAASAGAGW